MCPYDGKRFTHYTTKEGLSGDQVRGILEDKQGHQWFATNNGLSCFVPDDETQDRLDGHFTHIAIPHSLGGTILEDSQSGLWFDAVKNGVSPSQFRDPYDC